MCIYLYVHIHIHIYIYIDIHIYIYICVHIWIRRVTHHIKTHIHKLKIESWVSRARGNKWDLAGKVSHHVPERWTNRLLNWDPSCDFDGIVCRASRRQAHPKLRWTDDLTRFMNYCNGASTWQQLASHKYTWTSQRDEFCEGLWRST